MRLDNIINLTEGKLLSNPFITQVEGFFFEAHLVERGGLYFAADRSVKSVELAIKQGAYAIVYDTHFEIIDSEIAWIEVQNLQDALIKLLRFQITQNGFKFLFLNKIEYGVLGAFSHEIVKLPRSVEEIFLKLFSTKKSFFCSSDKVLLEKIAPEFFSLNKPKNKVEILPQSTLFLSSFIYKESLYNTLVSTLFIDEVCSLIDFFEYTSQPFSISKKVDIFESIFVNSSFGIEPFGATKRAIICFSDEQNFNESLQRLKSYFPTLKISTCRGSQILEYEDFHYLFVQDDPQNIVSLLRSHTPYIQPSLF